MDDDVEAEMTIYVYGGGGSSNPQITLASFIL
jgi:hypothetical protein